MQLEVKTDNKAIIVDNTGAICIRVSSAENNGAYLDSDGVLHVKRGKEGSSTGTGGTINTGGNAIEAQDGKGVGVLRCNSTVSRLKKVDKDIEAPQILDIVSHILSS